LVAPVVWIVDADQWPRAHLRAELIERGYDAVGFVKLQDALARLVRSKTESPPRAILIDLEGQTVREEQLALCADQHLAVILTGGKVALAAPGIRPFPAAAVLPRPVTLGELADAVDRLIGPAARSE
jgi:DNA-binding NtrC family response regulator